MEKLDKAITLLRGVTATAKILGVSQGCVSNWRMRGTPVPAELCPLIELHTQKAVSCEDLRPDVRWDVLRSSARTLPGSEPCAEIKITAAPDAANDTALDAPEKA